MSRTLTWNDKYCPNGHTWQFVSASMLFPDYYWCPVEDKFWEPTVKETTTKNIQNRFNTTRPEEMRKHAQFLMWLDSLTPKDMPTQEPTKKGKE